MSAGANAAPVIIKKKKVISGDGHHGGAWKVAYADFVTAMMAFFMLMWLLNATTEQQRSGIADYFAPTIPITQGSGGGTGAFGGDSIFAQENMPQNGTGGIAERQSDQQNARGDTGAETARDQSADEDLEAIEELLMGQGGETMVMENALRHIVTRITDEGLVIELFELENARLFEDRSSEPTQLLEDLMSIIANTARIVENDIAVEGYVRARPIVVADAQTWEVSTDRATRVRRLLEARQIDPARVKRVTGHADRSPVLTDTMARRNNRVEVILLR